MTMSLKIESKENSLYGTDTYRNKSVIVPRAYQPIASLTAAPNKDGTNVNMSARVDDFVVATVDGRQVMTDRFIATAKFTALQSVVAQVERERAFDSFLALLIASRESIITGVLPDEPLLIKDLPAGLFD